MRRRTSRLGGTLAVAALAVGLLAFPAGAAAQTNAPIAQTGGMTATLPLLGTSLTVDVTLDTVGNISGVALTPTGVVTQTSADPTVVKFANTAGTTKVSVRAKGDKMSISAKSASLDDFLGSGTWSADVFGTGAKSTVDYTIGKDGSGNPTLAIGTVTPASGVTFVVNPPKTESEDGEASASGGVTFAHDGFVKRLRISIEVDEEGGAAHLRITLSGKDRQMLTGSLAELAAGGVHTWSAYLCDGTTLVTASFHVNVDGSVASDGTTGAPASVKTLDHGLQVRFTKTTVKLLINLRKNGEGTYTLMVKGFSGSCGKGHGHGGDSHAGTLPGGDPREGDRNRG